MPYELYLDNLDLTPFALGMQWSYKYQAIQLTLKSMILLRRYPDLFSIKDNFRDVYMTFYCNYPDTILYQRVRVVVIYAVDVRLPILLLKMNAIIPASLRSENYRLGETPPQTPYVDFTKLKD